MRKRRLIIAVLLFAVFFVNTQGLARESRGHYLWQSIVDPPHCHRIQLPDGHRSWYYHFETGEKPSETVIFFFSGSNAQSLRYYLKPYFADLKMSATIYSLQKRHLGNWSTKGGKAFVEDNYLERWLDDDAFFLDYILKTPDLRPKRIMAFGVSEGGNRAVVAASRWKRITHLIVLGSGGLRQADELKILSPFYGGTPEAFEGKYREILAEPDRTDRLFLGMPHKYWSHVLFFDPLPHYTQLEIPVFLAQGAKDRSSPIESAYYLREKFKELGKDNLFFLEAADCGHTFVDSKGLSHTGEVFAAIRNWLADR